MRIAVIGTGISAFFLVKGLIENQIKPDVFDIGKKPNTTTNILKKNVLKDPRNYKFSNKFILNNRTFIPKKNYFGDSFAYTKNNLDVDTSNSFGGFSNVWGSTLNKLSKEKINEYPFSNNFLDNYYDKVIRILKDNNCYSDFNNKTVEDYEKKFGLLSSQLFESSLKRNKLSKFKLKKSLLAVNSNECTSCGLCLTGCPKDLIYNTNNFFEDLKDANKIRLNLDHKLYKFEKNKNTIDLFFKNQSGNLTINYDYVFICCGPIESSKILSHSLPDTYNTFEYKTSQKYLSAFSRFPFFYKKDNFDKMTLSSLSLNFFNKSENYIQISSVNNLVLNKFKLLDNQTFKILRPILLNFLSSHIYLWAGLESSKSGKIVMTKKNNIFLTENIDNNETKKIVKENLILLKKYFYQLNFFYLPFSLNISNPGEGNHYGANLPMKRNINSINETDMYGRIAKFKNVSVVDSSILNDIPVNTIALTLMANALRIGKNFNQKFNHLK